jgi:hypothetical protein
MWTYASLAVIALVCAAADERPVTLENARVRIVFDAASGGLLTLEDRVAQHPHRMSPAPAALWSLRCAGDRVLSPASAGVVTCRPLTGGQHVEIVWSSFEVPEAPHLAVTAQVALDADEPTSHWRISVAGLGDLVLQSVHYPRLTDIAPQESERLAVPVWMGEQSHHARQLVNATAEGGRLSWAYPGLLSLQCLAYCRAGGPGILIMADDTRALRKEFAVFGDGQGALGLETVHIPAGGVGSDRFEPPYAVRVSLFQGDWYTAAEQYRQWAQNQAWVTASRVRRGATPAWVTDTGLWIWNRGRSPGVLEPAAALQQAARVPVSVFWHWWHGCPYDAGFPEYLPPREGAEPFRAAVAAAHEQGLHAIVYMNQRLWGMTTRSWTEEGAARFAVKNPDGSITPEVYNTFMNVPCASMCMGTDFWRAKYAELAAEAVCELGVDGIYMDQACSSLACYDTTHGHPRGGGAWWMEGFERLQADIRQRCNATRPVALAGEGCGEAWLPYLDLMLSLQVSMERYAAPRDWEPIPLFQAVYHDCAVLFGNYASLTRPPYDDLWPAEHAPDTPLALLDAKFGLQFRLEQGRAFVWGQQPTLANFLPEHLSQRNAEMEFVLHLARLRRVARKYLQDGVMLRPPETRTETVTIPISRLSIYAGQHDAVQEYAKTVPRVLASAWQAADRNVAVALVNVSDQPIDVRLRLATPDYPLAAHGAIRRICDDGSVVIGEFDRHTATLAVTLSAADAHVYEFAGRESYSCLSPADVRVGGTLDW